MVHLIHLPIYIIHTHTQIHSYPLNLLSLLLRVYGYSFILISLSLSLACNPRNQSKLYAFFIIIYLISFLFLLLFRMTCAERKKINMSCNGCRVLRKGCSENCMLRQSIQWIGTPQAQANATVFVAKFFGRAGLMSFISAVPETQRPCKFL